MPKKPEWRVESGTGALESKFPLDNPTPVIPNTPPLSRTELARSRNFNEFDLTKIPFITVETVPELQAERFLVAGSGISIKDNGPNSSIVVSFNEREVNLRSTINIEKDSVFVGGVPTLNFISTDTIDLNISKNALAQQINIEISARIQEAVTRVEVSALEGIIVNNPVITSAGTIEIGLDDSGVIPGEYNLVTVDRYGRVVSAEMVEYLLAASAQDFLTVDDFSAGGIIELTISGNSIKYSAAPTEITLIQSGIIDITQNSPTEFIISAAPTIVTGGGIIQVNQTSPNSFNVSARPVTIQGFGIIEVSQLNQNTFLISAAPGTTQITGGGKIDVTQIGTNAYRVSARSVIIQPGGTIDIVQTSANGYRVSANVQPPTVLQAGGIIDVNNVSPGIWRVSAPQTNIIGQTGIEVVRTGNTFTLSATPTGVTITPGGIINVNQLSNTNYRISAAATLIQGGGGIDVTQVNLNTYRVSANVALPNIIGRGDTEVNITGNTIRVSSNSGIKTITGGGGIDITNISSSAVRVSARLGVHTFQSGGIINIDYINANTIRVSAPRINPGITTVQAGGIINVTNVNSSTVKVSAAQRGIQNFLGGGATTVTPINDTTIQISSPIVNPGITTIQGGGIIDINNISPTTIRVSAAAPNLTQFLTKAQADTFYQPIPTILEVNTPSNLTRTNSNYKTIISTSDCTILNSGWVAGDRFEFITTVSSRRVLAGAGMTISYFGSAAQVTFDQPFTGAVFIARSTTNFIAVGRIS